MVTFDDDDRAAQGRAIFEGLGGVFQNLTGKSYDDVTSDEMTGSPRSMLQYLFPGRSDRQQIDTRLAAQRLGVSQRTVQRWARDDRIPRAETLKKVRTRTRQTVTTKRGRTQMAKRLAATAPSTGRTRRITIHGLQGPTTDPNDRQYLRLGNSHLNMSPEQQAELYEAWASGGDDAAIQYLTSKFDGGYVDGWRFHGIDGISWKDAQ